MTSVTKAKRGWVIAGSFLLLMAWSPRVSGQSSRPGMGAIPYAGASGTGVTFRVWAPNASAVGVKGQFNGWGTTALVNEGGGSGLWSADISGARTGQEYKVRINNSTDKRDPRARRVVNSAGNSIIYNPTHFDWGSSSFSTPYRNDLVIYEMHVGTYNAESWVPSSFDKVIERLDHVKNLGINAVQVMPICEFPGDKSWGYNPSDIFSVESALGGADGFKRFVKACHERGLAVLVDVVHNHYGPTDLDLWQFDGWSQNGLGGIYFYNSTDGKAYTWWGSTRPDFGRSEVRSFIRDQIFMWLDEYRVDGFRWDSVFNIVYYNDGNNYNNDGKTLLEQINWEMGQTYPGKIRIAEDHAFDYNENFDSQWHVGFHDDLKGQVTPSSDASRNMSTVASVINGWPSHNRVIFSESHDTVGDLNNKHRLPRDIDSGNADSIWARKRALLAAGVVMTAPGVPMLFQGQEMHDTWDFSAEQTLRWSLTNTYAGIVRAYRDMIRLRRNLGGATAGLKGTGVNVHHVDNVNKVIAYTRWDAGSQVDDVVAVANFSVNTWNDNSYIIQFPSAGTWYSQFNGDSTNYQADFGNIGPASVVATGSPPRAPVNMGMYSLQIFSKGEAVSPGSVSFDPASPSGCVEVKITYDPLDHPLKNASPVYIYLGRNDWQDVAQMAMSNGVGSTWEYTHTIPAGTYRLDMVFNDGGSIWDSNLGTDWHLTISSCPGGTPSDVELSPTAPQGCVPLRITYHANEGPLQAATNIYLHIGRNGWLDVVSPAPALTQSVGGAWSTTYAIPAGTRRINFVFHDGQGNWDNHFSQDWAVSVTNCAPPPPHVAITNPPTTISLPAATETYTLSGTASVSTVGHLLWSNQLSGAQGYVAAGLSWSAAGLPLATGTNVFLIQGTNSPPSAAAADSASNAAYSTGWADGSNGGSGWGGGWMLATSGGSAGHFRASTGGVNNLSLADFGWGLWANNGDSAQARRPLAAPLRHGDIVRVGFDNSGIDVGGSVGFALDNDDGKALAEFYFVGGDTNYLINDKIASRPTGIPWTSSGQFCAFQLQGTTQYLLTAGSSVFTGTLAQLSVQRVTSVRMWNLNAGVGTDRNLYVTELSVTTADPPPASVSHSDSETLIRQAFDVGADSDGDGIPDSWEARYYNSITGAVAGGDTDLDGHTAWEEYVADTSPTNPGSYYPNRITNSAMNGPVVSLVVGPPTTNTRIYDVAWSTNLLQTNWTAFNLNFLGAANGSALTLTVTNLHEMVFYRTGVKVP